jgi:hypothetical protein
VIAVDASLLVCAHRLDSPFNRAAHALIGNLAAGPDRWAIPWPCVHEFLAITTHPKLYHDPTPLPQALAQLDAWRDTGNLVLLAETPGAFGILRDLLAGSGVVGGRVHDAKVAAICLAHRVTELWTADRDFDQFPDLHTRNPLAG